MKKQKKMYDMCKCFGGNGLNLQIQIRSYWCLKYEHRLCRVIDVRNPLGEEKARPSIQWACNFTYSGNEWVSVFQFI